MGVSRLLHGAVSSSAALRLLRSTTLSHLSALHISRKLGRTSPLIPLIHSQPITSKRQSPASSPISPSLRFTENQPSSEPLRSLEKNPSKSYATTAFRDLDVIAPEIFPKNVAAASVRRAEAGYSHNDRIRDTLRKVQRTQFLERVALIYACVQTGNMARAEMLYHRLLLSNPEDMKEIMDVRFINAFIEAYLEPPDGTPKPSKAEEWFGRFEQYGLTPDETSFAVVIRYFIDSGDMGTVQQYLERMEMIGIHPRQLLDSARFMDASDRAPLEAVLKKLGKDSSGYTSVDDLILSALEESSQNEASAFRKVQEDLDDDSSSVMEEAVASEAQQREPLVVENQKSTDSLGIQLMRKTLTQMTKTNIKDRFELQKWLEEEAYNTALLEREHDIQKLPTGVANAAQFPNHLLVKWHTDLVRLIEREMAGMKEETEDPEEHAIAPFMELVKPAQLSLITITEFVRHPAIKNRMRRDELNNGLHMGEHVLSKLADAIGSAIEIEHNMQQLKKKKNQKMLRTQMSVHELHSKGKLFNASLRKVLAKVAAKELNNDIHWKPQWPQSVKVQIGALLSTLLMKCATVTVRIVNTKDPNALAKTAEEPAFYHAYRRVRQKKVGVIVFNPALLELLTRHSKMQLNLRLLPMIVTPRPWLTWRSGGYLLHEEEVVRLQGNLEHRALLNRAAEEDKLHVVLHSLDVLGATPWRVNVPVLEVVLECWNSGQEIGGIPPEKIDEIPPPPEDYETNMEAKRKYNFLKARRLNDARNAFSKRCSTNYTIDIATALSGEMFYFPHSLDFRGRAYPIPPHFNHIGNDLCRGLLLFDKAKPIGERGLMWLKVQLANLYGYDKVPFHERAEWTEDHLDDIFDSAEQPMNGKRFWLKADKPWQFLANCMELKAALSSDDPLQYASRMHIHQDGTCNGLQHYAALGGDVLGAQHVNLVPSDRPADVYSGVANQVRALIQRDAEAGLREAILIKDHVTRKLVKQTVMTNTYGVTFVGAKDQVMSRLRESKADHKIAEEDMNKIAIYVAHKIFESLGTLFEGARAIQKWLNTTAKLISSSSEESKIPAGELRDALKLNEMGVLPGTFSILDPSNLQRVEEALEELSRASVEDAKELSEKKRAVAEKSTAKVSGPDEDMEDFASLEPAETADEEPEAPETKQETKKEVFEDGGLLRAHGVMWTTPLGLPIVQPYREYKTQKVNTMLQSVSLIQRDIPAPVDARKQSTAFPPNFIHSIDAAHMMLSAIACQRHGLTYASVHDSYWTHPSDVDMMSNLLRQAFIAIHSQNLMERLRDEFVARYKTHKIPVIVELGGKHIKEMNLGACVGQRKRRRRRARVTSWVNFDIPPLPPRGSFDIQVVRNSPYFFH
ncbi:hypothetical protein BJ742DRAFT_708766 [Cladochytrium replicatum]|nr:hypothetical protein BJ742DRAFT_708766 [Cladochytrium replicatum]